MSIQLSEAAREARLRRAARRQGYVLRRSRWHLGSIDNYGEFMIVDADRNWTVAGLRFDMTLDDVERFLAK